MGVHYSDEFKESLIGMMEGYLPPFSPLILRLLGGACAAVILTVYNPDDAPTILWIIGILLCVLPALYSTILMMGEAEQLGEAFKGIKESFVDYDAKTKALTISVSVLLFALRILWWAIMYTILGGIVFIIYLVV